MKALLLPLVSLFMVGSAYADEPIYDIEYRLAAAVSMNDERELGLAMADLVGLACGGDAKAAAVLGDRYMSGSAEFDQAPGKALVLLRFASQSGDPRSMPGLVLLLSREGASQAEIEEAAKWKKIGEALLPGRVEMALASQAFEIARNGRDVAPGYQAAAVWIHKRNLGMSTENASIDCSAW
ncbi:TPA: hypothetical protein MXR76_001995 [Pseudomonas aeruginosa]|uniref:hypothetical protein n=1 Tax=Pseudomonas aeruginosa TaxID=287 RepID=UPI00093FBF34|nr:hypothetical protein [Pseudomonas aeruginosa]EKF7417582.1 hypothetical protein [Pseudomonas aeruginosa]MDS9914857.1 hypothetical protein [Pseudomonas aeruginosa]HBO1619144.1 hypothetical protein [Pseudomonas aeruginosa]HCA5864519.1 hypothetical protein [Pseudomonas aeruginosa]HCA7378169.1 hypothetical protein [Pseudomonas aeruginosa]